MITPFVTLSPVLRSLHHRNSYHCQQTTWLSIGEAMIKMAQRSSIHGKTSTTFRFWALWMISFDTPQSIDHPFSCCIHFAPQPFLCLYTHSDDLNGVFHVTSIFAPQSFLCLHSLRRCLSRHIPSLRPSIFTLTQIILMTSVMSVDSTCRDISHHDGFGTSNVGQGYKVVWKMSGIQTTQNVVKT